MNINNLKKLFNEYFVSVLKNEYLTYNGRVSRAKFWYFVLFNFICSLIVSIIASTTSLYILSTIYSLALLCPGICITIRRMHDINKAGWWMLIPFYNIYLCCLPSDNSANNYGQKAA